MINLFRVRIRKIGGSFAAIIPKEGADRIRLRENEEVWMDIRRPNPLKELFGAGKLSKPSRELIKEFRKNESKYW